MSPRIKSDSPPLPAAKKRQPLFRRSAWISIFLLISLAIGRNWPGIAANHRLRTTPITC